MTLQKVVALVCLSIALAQPPPAQPPPAQSKSLMDFSDECGCKTLFASEWPNGSCMDWAERVLCIYKACTQATVDVICQCPATPNTFCSIAQSAAMKPIGLTISCAGTDGPLTCERPAQDGIQGEIVTADPALYTMIQVRTARTGTGKQPLHAFPQIQKCAWSRNKYASPSGAECRGAKGGKGGIVEAWHKLWHNARTRVPCTTAPDMKTIHCKDASKCEGVSAQCYDFRMDTKAAVYDCGNNCDHGEYQRNCCEECKRITPNGRKMPMIACLGCTGAELKEIEQVSDLDEELKRCRYDKNNGHVECKRKRECGTGKEFNNSGINDQTCIVTPCDPCCQMEKDPMVLQAFKAECCYRCLQCACDLKCRGNSGEDPSRICLGCGLSSQTINSVLTGKITLLSAAELPSRPPTSSTASGISDICGANTNGAKTCASAGSNPAGSNPVFIIVVTVVLLVTACVAARMCQKAVKSRRGLELQCEEIPDSSEHSSDEDDDSKLGVQSKQLSRP